MTTVYNRRHLHEIILVAAVLMLTIIVAACGADAPESQGDTASLRRSAVSDSMTIPRMLETDDRFSTLRAALDSTGLDSLLATDGPYTLFAPPNEAFDALPPGTMDVLLSEETERLRTILRHHVVEGQLSTEELSTSRRIIPLSGDTLSFRRSQDRLSVGETSVVDGDIEAANGLIHVVDRVLPPPPEPNAP